MTDLSILDLSPFRQGETFAQAVDNTVALAQHAEKLGAEPFLDCRTPQYAIFGKLCDQPAYSACIG